MAYFTPSKRNLKLEEFETRDIKWRILDKYKNPINLTDWTAVAEIKDELDGTLILTITTEDDPTTANIQIAASAGEIVLHFQKVLESYAGVYDLFLIDPDGESHKLVKLSSITVNPSVTTI